MDDVVQTFDILHNLFACIKVRPELFDILRLQQTVDKGEEQQPHKERAEAERRQNEPGQKSTLSTLDGRPRKHEAVYHYDPRDRH